MRLKDHPKKDGMRVWLDESETQQLIGATKNIEQELALLLMARSGLRRKEMLQVTPADLVETGTGYHVRVWAENTKSGSYREPPVSEEVYNYARAKAEAIEPDDALIDRDPKTIYRWVGRAADRCRAESGEDGWQFVTPHDLRRTWGTQLLEAGVLPSVVMAWGGWEDWQTFRDHYLGEFSPEAIRRERQKVDYLADRTVARSEQSRAGYSAFEPRGKTHQNSAVDRF